MTDAWFLRLDVQVPIPDERLLEVRQQLLDTLEAAGFPAKPSTLDWSVWNRPALRPMGRPLSEVGEPEHKSRGIRGRR